MAKHHYERIILKLSGEVLGGPSRTGLDTEFVGKVLEQIKQVRDSGGRIGIVVGGGNILRGSEAHERGLSRVCADYIGMLGTIINGLAIRDMGKRYDLNVTVMSALPIGGVAEPYAVDTALEHLSNRRVVVFVGGTGNPFLTTDTAAALRAAEMGADVLLKATKVDGVYSSDPERDSNARRFETIDIQEAIDMGLSFMDRSALCVCSQAGIPIVVFNIFEEGSIARAVFGEKIGTIVEGVWHDRKGAR